jgi:hypothetical protein
VSLKLKWILLLYRHSIIRYTRLQVSFPLTILFSTPFTNFCYNSIAMKDLGFPTNTYVI